MKISRWIYIPFFSSVFYVVWMTLFGQTYSWGMFFYWLVGGAVFGFFLEFENYRKARKLSNGKDERAFEVYQKRTQVVLVNYEKSFDLCRDAILSIERCKIKNEDFENGKVRAKVGGGWESWGEIIDLSLKKINDNLTEIEISVSPSLKTTTVSYGRSWKIAEDVCNYLKAEDAKINKKVLADSVSIMEEVYIKPFQKEKPGELSRD